MKLLVRLVVCLWVGSGEVLAETGRARLEATDAISSLSGTVTLTETPEGLRVTAGVVEAPAGLHGFHIHQHGSCEDRGNAAGGHYNPTGAKHGFLPVDGPSGAHAGDLGNLEVGPNGSGTLTATLQGIALSGGPHSVAGRAVILHEKPDDFGQPTGNAGGRIACGVITIAED